MPWTYKFYRTHPFNTGLDNLEHYVTMTWKALFDIAYQQLHKLCCENIPFVNSFMGEASENVMKA
jgi:hypothetical protein